MSYTIVPYKGDDPELKGLDMVEFAADELKAASALQVPKFVTEGYVFPSLELSSPRSSKFVLTSNLVAAAVQHAVTVKPETEKKPFPWMIIAGIGIVLAGAIGAISLRKLRGVRQAAEAVCENSTQKGGV